MTPETLNSLRIDARVIMLDLDELANALECQHAYDSGCRRCRARVLAESAWDRVKEAEGLIAEEITDAGRTVACLGERVAL